MWRNADVLDVRRLAARAQRHAAQASGARLLRPRPVQPARSMQAVLAYLRQGRSGGRRRRARARYACFDHFGDDPQATAMRPCSAWAPSCEDEVVTQLVELHGVARTDTPTRRPAAPRTTTSTPSRTRAWSGTPRRTTAPCSGAATRIVEPARPAHGRHARRVAALVEPRRAPAKIVVWAHNSHLGDARATEMGERGELNVGQLVRERHGADSVLGRLHHLRRHGDGRVGLGRARRAQDASGRPCRQLRALFHDAALPAIPAAAARRRRWRQP